MQGAGRKGMPTPTFLTGGGGGAGAPSPPPPPRPRFLRLCVKFYTVWTQYILCHTIYANTTYGMIELKGPVKSKCMLTSFDLYWCIHHISLDFGIYICVKYFIFFSIFFFQICCAPPPGKPSKLRFLRWHHLSIISQLAYLKQKISVCVYGLPTKWLLDHNNIASFPTIVHHSLSFSDVAWAYLT